MEVSTGVLLCFATDRPYQGPVIGIISGHDLLTAAPPFSNSEVDADATPAVGDTRRTKLRIEARVAPSPSSLLSGQAVPSAALQPWRQVADGHPGLSRTRTDWRNGGAEGTPARVEGHPQVVQALADVPRRRCASVCVGSV
eukprot:CAMPEP_0174383818 /NCGR_PEP_ID=MMETSP0811_2-20130205/125505_1 /TAXON_ID=73025 ORGANISM="Eutreptiella gymnastica-like, Strain CCMP1594" /NCGR_SAMPLE_ID=MMETSP0811_2 /ASSEMBLY_ACC=CAM_ASM_000667 /LENGTH=140 /DNA_ID=CAMNT_0015537565 /DNA_START=636 /DNA_END=1059 /DNA_ORIENTATION=+